MFLQSSVFTTYTQGHHRLFYVSLHALAVAVISTVLLFTASNTQAQELRLNSNVTIVSDMNSPFPGIGVGLEGAMGQHFAAVMDANFGFGKIGTLMMFKPGVHFYFKKGQTGFFFGPKLSYMKMLEKNDEDIYVDNIYGGGFSIGVKSRLSTSTSLHIMLTPQLVVGDTNGDGGTATLQVGLGFNL